MKDPKWTHILLRFSEIWLKSKVTRKKLLRILSQNIQEAAGEHPLFENARLVIGFSPEAFDVVKRVFGIKSISPALKVEHARLVEEFKKFSEQTIKGRKFRVTVNRSWKGYPKRSTEMERELGAVAQEFGIVDLTQYDVNMEVEIHEDGAYLFADRIPGPGGMPYGSEGRALAMFSGGIDSPVAAWMVARRGAALELLFLNPLGRALESRVHQVFGSLKPWIPGARLHVVNIKKEVDEMTSVVKEGSRQTVYKRLMYRVAQEAAVRLGCAAIVTGESLGQVSSQTLQSLAVIDEAVAMPVFRPLIGMDKDEVVALARKIGTFESSSSMQEFCSIESHSNASPTMEGISREEKKLRFDYLSIATRAREVVSGETAPKVPDGDFTVIKMWEGIPKLKKGGRYLFVCKQGHRSAEEALNARENGIDAYSLDYKAAKKKGII